MGRIADALRENLRTIAQSDARSLRALDQELKAATSATSAAPELPGMTEALALIGKGSFQQQSAATLKGLCRQHGIRGYSKWKKAELAQALEDCGAEPPPRPIESFTKKELVALVKQLMALLG